MDQHIRPGPNGAPQWRQEIVRLAQQVLVAFCKFLAVLLFMGMHWVLDWAIAQIIPTDWIRSRGLLKAIVTIAFMLLYVDQLIEMLAVFFPRLGTFHARFTGRHT
jgi:hypothetical protein